jgi:L-cysteine:1D-myo-inositol 2-amino-2-deoxy-alpha-D-glucopyranoside ligase
MQAWRCPDVPTIAGSAPVLRLYDSSRDAVLPTVGSGVASMYVCGITPYDATHIGHAATYLSFDLVHRYWHAAGVEVRYVQNVTDVDDPLLERADRDGVDWRDLAAREIDLFRSDMTALRVLPPHDYLGAVESVEEIAAAVQELLDAGHAYRLPDADHPDVYFDHLASGDFGYESRLSESEMLDLFAERGGDPDRPGKKHPLDPLLWRMERPGEPAWASPMGLGRPGWHIECAVIATRRLGPVIDVQGGGADLLFPHHEYSAAHAETLSGRRPFARHYTHAGMITMDGQKMSKSLGNLAFVNRLLADGADPAAVRAALYAGHYRQDRAWSGELLAAATARVGAWRSAARRTGGDPTAVVEAVRAALADDLDTPSALAALDRWAADDSLAGPPVADAVDALLGIDLRG